MPRIASAITAFNAGEWSETLRGRWDLAKYPNACRTLQNFIPLREGGVTYRPGFEHLGTTKSGTARLIPFVFSSSDAIVIEAGDEYFRFWKSGDLITLAATVSGTANAGGLVRITTSAAHGYATGWTVTIAGVGGTTEANGTWVITVINTTTFDLVGSTFANAWTSGGTATGIVEVSTPYQDTELDDIQFAQSADILFLAHPSYAPRKLSRFADTSWTLAAINWASESRTAEAPWRPINDSDITMTASARTGSGVTLTASAAYFDASMVGSFFWIGPTIGKLQGDTWQLDSDFAIVSQECIFAGRQYILSTKNGITNSGTTPPTWTEGSGNDGNWTWAYSTDGSGVVEVTGYTSSTVVTVTVHKKLVDTSATKYWRESAFSAYRGYPRAVAFFQERLCFGFTETAPQTVWMSKTGDFYNFEAEEARNVIPDDNPLTLTISDDTVNFGRWFAPARGALICGTDGGEFTIQADSNQGAVTPSNVTVRRETSRQCSYVRPVNIGPAVIFAQRARKALYELAYDFNVDGFSAPDLSLFAPHLLRSQINEMAWQGQPYGILWMAMDDGGLRGLTYLREQEVLAWHKHPVGGTDAQVLSVATIPAAEQDDLYAVTSRTIDSVTVYHVERMGAEHTEDTAKEDYAHADAWYRYDSTATGTITGLDHLEGETVAVYADGGAHADKTVASGSITLDRNASVVLVGLPYTGIVEPMDLEPGARDGSSFGRQKRIHDMSVLFVRTLGAQVGVGDDFRRVYGMVYDTGDTVTLPNDIGVPTETLYFRRPEDNMDASPPLWTGHHAVKDMPGGWGDVARFSIKQTQPLPVTVAAVSARLTINEG